MEPLRRLEAVDPAGDTQRRRAIAATHVGSWHRHLGTGVAQVDVGWCQALGLDPCTGDDHIERWARRIHPDDAARFLRAHLEMQDASAARHEFELEYRILTLDSRWLWLLQRGRVLRRDDEERPLEVAGICIEIDARKRAEVEAHENESRLATALWGARAAFWQIHRPSDTAFRSPLWYAMTGYTQEAWEEQSQPWLSRVHPDDQPLVQRLIDEHLEGRSQHLELKYRLRCANGAWKWIMDRGRVVEWDFDGQPVALIGVSIDIDEQKRAELALRSTEARLETAIWGAGVGLYELDCTTGATRWLNDWCSRFDIDPCEGEDHVDRWDSHIHPADLGTARVRFSGHLEGREEYYDAEYRIRTRAGAWRWIFERGRVVERDAAGQALRLVGTCMDIDERKRAALVAEESQLRLRQSEQLLSAVTAHAPIWLMLLDTEVRIAFINRPIGAEPTEGLIGRCFYDFFDQKAQADLRALYTAVLADGVPRTGEIEFVAPDGRVRLFDHRVAPVLEGGRIAALSVSGTDITERRAAEASVQHSEALLQTVAAHAHELITLFDRDLRCIFMNRGNGRLDPGECLGRAIGELVKPVDRPRVEAAARDVIATGRLHRLEQVYERPGGEKRFVEARFQPVLEGDRITGCLVVSVDITAFVQQREALAAQATLLSVMREPVLLLGRDYTVRLSNPAFDALLGATPGTLQGCNIRALLVAAVGDLRGLAHGAGALQARRAIDWRRPDGQLLHLVGTYTPVRVEDEELTLAVYVDVTAERRLERQIVESAAREQQRLSADLHDGLGQELTGIALLLRSVGNSLGEARSPHAARVDEIIHHVNHAIDSTRRLARGLAPVSQQQGGLPGALQTLAHSLDGAHGLRVHFESHVSPALALDDEVATHLFRIAQEAVSNVLRHAGAHELHLSLEKVDRELVLTVQDDGRGFPDRVELHAGIGIQTMRFRAAAVRGCIEMEGHKGVTIRCRVPVD